MFENPLRGHLQMKRKRKDIARQTPGDKIGSVSWIDNGKRCARNSQSFLDLIVVLIKT